MLCAAPIATLLVLAGPADSPAAEFLAPYAGAHFPPPFEEALDAFLEVEAAYRDGEYDQARAVLSALWDRCPAGGSWQLTPDLENGLLACDSRSPYYDSDPVGGRSFRLVLRRDEEGGFLAQPRGFVFGGGFYERMPDEPRERE